MGLSWGLNEGTCVKHSERLLALSYRWSHVNGTVIITHGVDSRTPQFRGLLFWRPGEHSRPDVQVPLRHAPWFPWPSHLHPAPPHPHHYTPSSPATAWLGLAPCSTLDLLTHSPSIRGHWLCTRPALAAQKIDSKRLHSERPREESKAPAPGTRPVHAAWCPCHWLLSLLRSVILRCGHCGAGSQVPDPRHRAGFKHRQWAPEPAHHPALPISSSGPHTDQHRCCWCLPQLLKPSQKIRQGHRGCWDVLCSDSSCASHVMSSEFKPPKPRFPCLQIGKELNLPFRVDISRYKAWHRSCTQQMPFSVLLWVQSFHPPHPHFCRGCSDLLKFSHPFSEGFFHSLRRLFCNPSAITSSGWPACLHSTPANLHVNCAIPGLPQNAPLKLTRCSLWVSLAESAFESGQPLPVAEALQPTPGKMSLHRNLPSLGPPPDPAFSLLDSAMNLWHPVWLRKLWILRPWANHLAFQGLSFSICRMGPAAPTLLAYQVKEWTQWDNWLLGTIKLPSSLGRTPGLVLSVSTGSREAEQ